MLVSLLIWVYIIALSLVYGATVRKVLSRILGFDETIRPNFLSSVLFGLVIITTINSYFSLFFKINILVYLILLIGAIFLVIFRDKESIEELRHYWKEITSYHPVTYVLFFIALFFFLYFSTFTATIYDTNLYHAQAIKWIENYSVVPGLGNLHGRLAFNSAWFITAASFSFSFINEYSMFVLGELLVMLALSFSFIAIGDLLRNQLRTSNWVKALLLPILVLIYIDNRWLATSTPDLPSMIFVFLIGVLFLELFEKNVKNVQFHPVLIFTFIAFVLTVKISAFPVILLAFYLIYKYIKQPKLVMVLVLLGFVIGIPWAARNVILSGYLVYPVASIDIFDFEWEIPASVAENEQRVISGFAKMPTMSAGKVSEMSVTGWVGYWHSNLLQQFEITLTYVIPLLTLLWFGVLLFQLLKFKEFLKKYLSHLVLGITCLLGILFWFFSAPDPRFGAGYIYLYLAFTLGMLLPVYTTEKGRKKGSILSSVRWVMLPLVVTLFGVLLYQNAGEFPAALELRTKNSNPWTERLLVPDTYLYYGTRPEQLNGFTVYVPLQSDLAGYAPLPSTPYPNKKLHLRGEDIGDGFVMKE